MKRMVVNGLLLALGAALFGILMYQLRTPQQLNLGAQDSFFLQGFHLTDKDAAAGFRWTNGDGRLNLWNLGAATPLVVRVRANALREDAIPIQFFINGEPVGQFENRDWETYEVRVPDTIELNPERLRVWIQSSVVPDPTAPEERDLGVAVASVQVQPLWGCAQPPCRLTDWLTIPPIAPLFQYILLIVFVFILLLALGVSLKQTLWLAGGLTIVLGLLLGFSRLLTVQYLPALMVLAGALAVGAGISRYAYDERQKQGLPFGLAEALALIFLFVVLLIHLNRLVVAFADPGEDGQVLFMGARQIWDNAPLYDVAGMRANLFAPLYKLAPFYALLEYPYRSFGVVSFIFGLRVVSELLYLTSLVLLARVYKVALVSTVGYGIVIIGLLMDPVADALRQAQTALLILFLLTLSLVFVTRRREGWAGVFIAVPFLIKLYPAFFLLPLLLLRRWRALASFASATLVLFGFGVLVVGWEQNWLYLTEVLPQTRGSTAWPENASVYGFLARFFTDAWGTNDFSTPTLQVVYYVCAIAITGISVFVFMRYLANGESFTQRNWREWLSTAARSTDPSPADGARWGYALFALTLLIVAPLTWNHYLSLAMLAIPALLVYLKHGAPPLWILFSSAIGIALLVFGIYPIPLQELNFGAWSQLIVSYRFYGLVLLWVVLLFALWTAPSYKEKTRLSGSTVDG